MVDKSKGKTKQLYAELYFCGILLDRLFPVEYPRDIYLLHRANKTNKSFEEEYVFPTTPSLKKATFKWTGEFGRDDHLIYEFSGLE